MSGFPDKPARGSAMAVAVAAGLSGVVVAGAWGWIARRREPGPAPTAPAPRASAAGFVGSVACAGCHLRQYLAWSGSQHARAIQPARPSTVRGNFDGAELAAHGVTSTFVRRGDRFFVTTDGPGGDPVELEVTHTFGLEPLQQYLVPWPGGRLQALPMAWDTRAAARGGQRWFHLYPEEPIDPRDELHWTKPSQTWNAMCADCHSTHVESGYDPSADTFATTSAEMGVGCEACHGPAAGHIAWADGGDRRDPTRGLTVALDERRGVGWTPTPSGTAARDRARLTAREIEVCAPCHSRRAAIAGGYQAGRPFLDHYLPALLTTGLYHPDGQQRAEVYEWASFLSSKMFRAGVTCADCHDPHSSRLRGDGNATCAQCHAPARFDTAAHHFHPPSSSGGRCASCHMPETTYMGHDRRRDHSLRVPRPDRSVALGVPNACTGCHRDRDDAWAADAYRRWYGGRGRGAQTFAEAFHAAEAGAPGADVALAAIAADPSQSEIARASALERLATATSDVAQRAGMSAVGDASPLVRLAAARLAAALPLELRRAIAAPLLADPLRAVRVESARALAPLRAELAPDRRRAWQRAADEYVASLARNADRPDARVELGTFFADGGSFDRAQAEFARARELAPGFAPAYLNAADVFRAAGREDAAEAVLMAGLSRVRRAAALHHALGLGYVRQQRPEAALRALAQAVALEPDERRYVYVYAVALHSYGRAAEALRRLEAASVRWPDDPDLAAALASMRGKAAAR